MNVLGALHTLLSDAARPVQGAVQGAERALGVGQPQGVGQAAQGIGQALQARPDFTYNPNPNTNIPNSSHNLQQVMAANGRLQLHPPQAGVPMRGPINLGQNNFNPQMSSPQNMNMAANPQAGPGNQFNPGYSPLQATTSFGGGPRGVQPFAANPQVQDMDPTWY